jgi:predicted metal-dependent phosphoesterase TrpH
VIHPGADTSGRPDARREGPPEIVFSDAEERGALRLFIRALRRLPRDIDWQATIWLHDPAAAPAPALSRRMRERVRLAGPADGSEAQHLARATISVAASAGTASAPQLVLRSMAAGAVPVVSRLPQYEELVRDGELGPLFEPRDAITLAAQLERLLRDPTLVLRYAGAIDKERPALDWSRVADDYEALYERVAARRHDENGKPQLRRRLAERAFVHVDLHMHTDHSPDCATPVDTLLEAAKSVGLGAIAITDHNEISGALEAAALDKPITVIVGEEVKTSQGEVIGLFLHERIERGMSMADTIAEIQQQGGLVLMPHPFDRLHTIPDSATLLRHLDEIDVFEVYNSRLLFDSFNDDALRFATKYNLVQSAGSDAHVLQGIGTAVNRIPAFDGPEEFLVAMRHNQIVRRPRNLLYLQGLKWMQQVGKTGS